MGGDASLSSELTVNWCKLLLCFIERCKENKNKIDFLNLNYEDLKSFLNFMDLDSFFGDEKMKLWINQRVKIIYDMSKNLDDLNICTWLQIINNLVVKEGGNHA